MSALLCLLGFHKNTEALYYQTWDHNGIITFYRLGSKCKCGDTHFEMEVE